ncbi:MAG: MATE family efflux transporter [Candidatus Methanomethylophilaceae archaeon]|jgi:putative MATE family efflux protein
MMRKTGGSENLLGDPRKAVIGMAVPIALALLIQYINSFADMFWVSGLGADSLAAVSVITPIYSVIVSIGTGIGIGASYAIAKRIGEGNLSGASSASGQAIVITLMSSVPVLIILLVSAVPLMEYMGASGIMDLCLSYAYPVILSSPLLMIGGTLSGCFRGEGAAERSTAILAFASVSNIILDPILIYGLDLGIVGAAYATVISSAVSLIPALYWHRIKKDVLVPVSLKDFRPAKEELKAVSEVGIPQTAELIIMSFMSVFFIRSISSAGGTDLVAVFEIGWRMDMILMVPAQAVGSALVPILSAAFGMGNAERVKTAFGYAMKISITVMLALMLISMIAAPLNAWVMTLSETSARLRPNITDMLRVSALMFPAFAIIFSSSALLQSMGRGDVSMVMTLSRNAVIAAVYAYLSSYAVASYMWWGMTVTEIAFGLLTLLVAYLFSLRALRRAEVSKQS